MREAMTDAADSAAFHRDGHLLVRAMWSPSELQAIRAAVEQLFDDAIDNSGVRVFAPEAVPVELLRICTEDPLRAVVRKIIGPDVEFLSLKPAIKTAQITTASPWHQDWPYWRGVHKVSAWIALDLARVDNGCLRVVSGSHIRSWTHQRYDTSEGFANRIAQDEIVSVLGEEALRSMPMQPGDVLFFHDLLLHSSYPNFSGLDRWSLIPTYRAATRADNHTVGSLWQAPITL